MSRNLVLSREYENVAESYSLRDNLIIFITFYFLWKSRIMLTNYVMRFNFVCEGAHPNLYRSTSSKKKSFGGLYYHFWNTILLTSRKIIAIFVSYVLRKVIQNLFLFETNYYISVDNYCPSSLVVAFSYPRKKQK